MNDEYTSIVKSESSSGIDKYERRLEFFTKVAEFAHDNPDGFGELAKGVGDAVGAVGKGVGKAVGAVGKGVGKAVGAVGDAVRIAAAAPAMIEKFRAEQKQLETLTTARLAELAHKYKSWAHAFDKEAAQRDRGLDDVEKALDKAIASDDREAMLKSLDAIIAVLGKTDLTKHSAILTEEWKGTTLTGVSPSPPTNLLENESGSFDPDF